MSVDRFDMTCNYLWIGTSLSGRTLSENGRITLCYW